MKDLEYLQCMICYKILPATEEYFNYTNTKKVSLKSWCRECEKEYRKKYREKHKERDKEYRKQYYQENKERVLERCKKYRQENSERIKQYKQEHKEDMKKYQKEYYKENKERIQEVKKQYMENHVDDRRTYDFNRKAKTRYNNEEVEFNTITTEEFLSIYEFFDNKCAYSGEPLEKGNRSIDHIIPLDQGGTNDLWNLVPCLFKYNCSKRNMDMEEWFRTMDCFSEERLEKIYEWISLNKGDGDYNE